MAKTCDDGVSSDDQTESDSSQTSRISTPRFDNRPQPPPATTPTEMASHRTYGTVADKYYASVLLQETRITRSADGTGQCAVQSHSHVVLPAQQQPPAVQAPPAVVVAAAAGALNPRFEMRLAMNQDIICDDNRMAWADPGPHLTSILGRDLSSYRRMTVKDIIMSRIVTTSSTSSCRSPPLSNNIKCSPSNEEASSLYCQQNNSKMDTPTPNRRKLKLPTWSNFGSVDRGKLHQTFFLFKF